MSNNMKQTTLQKINMTVVTVLAVIYVIIPIDIVPDLTPFLGFIDDAIAVLIAIGNAIRVIRNLKKEKEKWKPMTSEQSMDF